MVPIDPDLASVFRDGDGVNRALRVLVDAAQASTGQSAAAAALSQAGSVAGRNRGIALLTVRMDQGVPTMEHDMRCRVCRGQLEPRITDLPFKLGDFSIVILKALPVLQCRQCGNTESEQASRVDQLLAAVDVSAELEVIRYAA